MRAKTRAHIISVTAHEKVLLAFYRSMPLQQQRDVDGVLAGGWRLPDVAERFRAESKALDLGSLNASHIEPFLEASHDIVGVQRRAA